jgi:hypothetical protein
VSGSDEIVQTTGSGILRCDIAQEKKGNMGSEEKNTGSREKNTESREIWEVEQKYRKWRISYRRV